MKKIFSKINLPVYMKNKKLAYSMLFFGMILVAMIVVSFLFNVWLGSALLVALVVWFATTIHSLGDVLLHTRQYVSSLSNRIDRAEKKAIVRLPIGIILYDEHRRIQWYSEYLHAYLPNQVIIGKTLDKVDEELYFHIKNMKTEEKNVVWRGQEVKIVLDKEHRLIYISDVSEQSKLQQKYLNEQVVFGQIYLDNYTEISKSLNDQERSNLRIFVTNQLTEWAKEYNVYLKRVETDKFIALLNYQSLQALEKNKFKIIDHVRELTATQNNPVTLSMGFAYAKENEIRYSKIAEIAQLNLDLALARGGDQVVVRAEVENARFYGGTTNPMEKRTRVRSRVISRALVDLMKQSSNVVVMGHQYPDMDSIGSCIGIRRIARMNGIDAKIVVNPEQFSKDISNLIEEIQKQDQLLYADMITPEHTVSLVTTDTLLVLVDVHKPSITAQPELLQNTKKIVVIDHHRRGEEFPENPVLTYIEPYASSTVELISEFFSYQPHKTELIKKIEATAMLGGIIVDTRNFTLRTGTRTFDAASYLKSCGADTALIQRLLKENVDTYLMRSHLLERLKMVGDIGIAYGEDEVAYPAVVAAQTADMMLSMENIEASYVITQRKDGRVGISARSLGSHNVQTIMEKLGGGGHLTTAATQLEGFTVTQVVAMLIEVLHDKKEEVE